MEFKNLAEVTKLEEVPEGASVLAATAEGEVVRVPGDGLGGGQFVVKITLDEQALTATLDKTNDEIWEALNANMQVVGLAESGDGSTFIGLFMQVVKQIPDEGLIVFQCVQFIPQVSLAQIITVNVNHDDVVTVNACAFQVQAATA